MARFAILGASGIGAVHARVIASLGHTVAGFLGSSAASIARTGAALKDITGTDAAGYTDLQDLVANARPDALVVCTPVAMHTDHVRAGVEAGLPVFCEKPLLWREGADAAALHADLQALLADEPPLTLNLNNRFLLPALGQHASLPERLQSFSFTFHAPGPHTGEAVALDLLPHAFSLLQGLHPEAPVGDVERELETTRVRYRFRYGDVEVAFDLAQGEDRERRFEFAINGTRYQRGSRGTGESYRSLLLDDSGALIAELPDLFVQSWRDFLEQLEGNDFARGRAIAHRNMADVIALLRGGSP